MNSLRSVQQAKINFIFFQDIITAVMGILILITLMFSLSLRSGEFGATPDAPFQKQLQEIHDQLTQIEAENRAAQKQILDAAALPDPAILENQTGALRRQSAQAAEARQQSEAAAARAHRATNDVANAAKLQSDVAALEKNLANLRDQLTNAQRQSNAVYITLPPELRQTERQPIAFVVSKEKIQIHHLTATNSTDHALAVATDLNPLLANLNAARDYVIFYFRPSGAKWFTAFRDQTKSAGFEVGYDALEEQQQIIFATP